MSSLFNYELDEKNIRSTLQNAGHSEFTESLWSDFETNYCKSVCKQSNVSFIKLPEINLNINRNVILPAFFILALVGISAILLSFIDFKSDKEQQVERKLEPNANNYKKPVTTNAKQTVEKKSEVEPIKKEIAKPVDVPQSNTSTTSVTPQIAKSAISQQNTTTAVNNSVNTISTTLVQTEPASIAAVTATIATTQPKFRRRKTEKVPAEQIETIKAPALIKTEAESAEPEPDLEIKID